MEQEARTENLKRFYIYYLRRPDRDDPFEPGRGQPFYVGKGRSGRHLVHRWEANFLLHKPGRKNHKTTTIHFLWKQGMDFEEDIIFDSLTEQEAFEIEAMAIQAYGRKNNKTGILTNLTDGWEGCSGFTFNHTKETKQKIREKALGRPSWWKGKKKSKEFCQKRSELMKGKPAWNKGIPCTKETKEKISKSEKGENHWNFGGSQSNETKQKISRSNKGKIKGPLSNDHKEKLRMAITGIKRSDETKRKQSEAAKKRTDKQIPWNKGKSWTDEMKEKIRRAVLKQLKSKEKKQK